jgi:succinate-acetate transporter protein
MRILLKILSVTILAIGALKVTLGAKADRLLDPSISLETVLHPSVDSQIRFYGAAFSVYGVLLWMCSNDMTKYADVFKVLMIVFFLAGVARILSALMRGKPSIMIMGLAALEIFVPPVLLLWQRSL